jgi:D-psicose/D-tagatose/L-ribulose 3-epimerase
MKYGICTWVFGDEDLVSTAGFASRAGFDGLELMGDLRRTRPADVKAVLGDFGLSVLSLTPEDVDLAHPDSRTRAEALDYYLALLDLAAALGSPVQAPVVGCHGMVGRVRALADQQQELRYLVSGVQRIARRAEEMSLRLAMEVLNRYESHLLNTAAQAVEFLDEVGAPNAGILLDAYHMNIEEVDPALALLQAGDRLFLFHAADSNREAVGRGHTDFLALTRALRQMGYEGDVVLECTAAGPDPFAAAKGEGWLDVVRQYAAESLQVLKTYSTLSQPVRKEVLDKI